MSIRIEAAPENGEQTQQELERGEIPMFVDFTEHDNPALVVATTAILRTQGRLTVFRRSIAELDKIVEPGITKYPGSYFHRQTLPYATQDEYIVADTDEGEAPIELKIQDEEGSQIDLRFTLVPEKY